MNTRRVTAAAIVALAIVAGSACSGDAATLEDAAAKLDVPTEFAEIEAETLKGFSETTRSITFNTELSQRDACELAEATLAAWAGQDLPAPSTALPRTLCSYQLNNPINHDGVDVAVARVSRAKVNDAFIEDEDAPGGVESVLIFFRTDS